NHGLSLTGSGTVHVTTAPLFGKYESVVVSGIGGQPTTLHADAAGRIFFDVTLEAPHPLEEFTTAELAVEPAGPLYSAPKNVVRARSIGCDGDSACGHDGASDRSDQGR